MATSKATNYRVYRINENLRKAIKAKREANGVTTKAVLDAAVSESLPKVVSAMQTVGFTMNKSKVRPVRWAVDAELLGCLAVASKQTGIPANKLLMASLFLQTKGAK